MSDLERMALAKSTYRSGVLQPPHRRLPDLVSDAVAEALRYGCRLHSIAINSVPFDLEPIFTLRS